MSEDANSGADDTGSIWGEPPRLTRRIDGGTAPDERRHPLRSRQTIPEVVELRCNDYLALGGHAAIIAAQIAVLRGGGDDIYMSAAYLSEATMQRAIEQKMAAFLETEDAVMCQSGWCANVGLMQAITNQETQVYIDFFAHAAMWDGARSTGASIHPFRHNKPQHLEKQIRANGAGVIVVSAVYAGNGAICPLTEIADIAAKHGCELVVDESHTIGVYGRQGQGLVSALGLADKVTYRTFSLAKALITRGGMVTGPARIMDFFRYESRPAIFSSAVLQHDVASLGAALNVIQEEAWRRKRLRSNSVSLRRQLAELGFDVPLDGSQIIPLQMGSKADAVRTRDALARYNLFCSIVDLSERPDNGSFVCLSLNSELSAEDLERIAKACARVRSEATRAAETKVAPISAPAGGAL